MAQETVVLDTASLRIIEETMPLEFQQSIVTDSEESDETDSEDSEDDRDRTKSYDEMGGIYEGPGATI